MFLIFKSSSEFHRRRQAKRNNAKSTAKSVQVPIHKSWVNANEFYQRRWRWPSLFSLRPTLPSIVSYSLCSPRFSYGFSFIYSLFPNKHLSSWFLLFLASKTHSNPLASEPGFYSLSFKIAILSEFKFLFHEAVRFSVPS